MSKFYLSLIGLVVLLACSQSNEAETSEKEEASNTIIQEPKLVIETLQPASESYINAIRDKCDGIEATMYGSGASFSIFDPNSAYAFFEQIPFQAPSTNTKNQIGHIMFLDNGEKILLAGVYDNGTAVFMKIDDKEKNEIYYNILTGKARDLFVNVSIQKAK